MVAAVQVVITVLDINDNPPTFVKTNYNSTLTESTSIGTDVVTVMAMDPDSVSEHLLQRLLQNQSNLLRITYDIHTVYTIWHN